MDRREAIKAMGAWLTSAAIMPLVEFEPAGIIFPDPVNEITRVDYVGQLVILIQRQWDALFIFGDVVHESEEFRGWAEIINTT